MNISSHRWSMLLVAFSLSACARHVSQETRPTLARTSCAGRVSADSTVFDTTQVSEKPQIISVPRIDYPAYLRRRLVSGHVLLTVVVNADGRPDGRSVVVVHSDNQDFLREALKAVAGTRYSPGCKANQGVRVRVAFPVDFNVHG